MITLLQLEYIIAVDTYRHFVTAAEKCFVTQPTLSMQIKKLEDYLGVIIFDRSKHPVIPTEIGEKIIEQARHTLASAKQIKDLIDEFNGSLTGELTVGIIPSLAPYLLPLFAGNFTRKYPGVKLTIVELLTEEIIDRLKKDLIDVGLLVTPLMEPGIREYPLFYEKMMLYINEDHPFSQQKTVEVKDLASPDIWLLSKGHCFRSQVVNLCSYRVDKQENFAFEYESGSLETLKRMVDKEGGYTLLPELAADLSSQNSARIKQIADPVPIREVSLVFSRSYSKQRLVELLSSEIRQVVPQEMLNRERGKIVEWR